MRDDSAVRELFDEAADLPPDRRNSFWSSRPVDPATRAEVESLLAAYDDAGGFLDDHRVAAARQLEPYGVGARIDEYELLELLGEGGFARVFRARQSRPVRREVALKLIKLGMDTRAVIARFELERQALAVMDHPNIAAVYDAGATEHGRPYFVMELVRGPRITRYCEQNDPGIRDRLRLFIDVCLAVHHAHQKGILHRDLKPSNVLVTTVDGRAMPKVIDFGIAKAVGGERLTDATMMTMERQLLGTPQYMSPEQASSGGADVDTRADIYSLGAMLYELLAGAAPLDAPSGPSSAIEELRRLTSDEPLPRPSARATSPERSRALRGELDWIIGKCLEKDRRRRYESAAALAADLQAFLAHRPITAAPPTLAYQARKFVRRNTAAVVAASVIAAMFIGAAVISTMMAVRALRAERLAQSRLVETEAANANLQAVNDFLTRDMIGAADPAVTLGRQVTVLDALDNAARAVGGRFEGFPLVEAAVRDSVAMAYLRLGRADLALAHARPALEYRRAGLGEFHPDVILSKNHVAQVLGAQGDYAAAEAMFHQALDATRRANGDEHPLTISTLHQFGDLLSSAGKLAEAETMCGEAYDRARRTLGEDHPTTLHAAHNYALVLSRAGRPEEAEPLLRRVVERSRRVRGLDDPDTVTSVNVLAVTLAELGRRRDAEPLYLEVLGSRRRVLGEDHPGTLTAMHNYAGQIYAMGRHAEAVPLFEDLVARRRRVQGNEHPETLLAINAYADVLRTVGRVEEAATLHDEALAARRRVLGDDHSDTITSMSNYAVVLGALRRFDPAEALHREAVERARRTLGAEHPTTLSVANNLAHMLKSQKRYADAEPIERAALEAWRHARGPDNPYAIYAANNLAATLRSLGRTEEAAELFADVYQRAPRAQIAPATIAVLTASYGPTLVRLKRFDEADAPLRDAHRRLVESGQATHPRMREVLAGLAIVCDQTGRSGEAASWRGELESFDRATVTPPTTAPATAPTTSPAPAPASAPASPATDRH